LGATFGIAGLLLLAVLACVLFTRVEELGKEREGPPPPRDVPRLEWFLVTVYTAAEPAGERMETLARRVTALG
jgi:hypothetical protein